MPELPTSFKEFSKALDAMGEEAVRISQASAKWGNNGTHKNWADEWIRQRADQRASDMHVELLAEIKRPHWSVTPTFWLLIVAVFISLLALAVSVFGLPQVQKIVADSPTPPQASTSAATGQASSSLPSPSSPAAQSSRPQK